MSKKVIIVSRRLVRKNKLINWVSEVYTEILLAHGIIPVIIPITKNVIPRLQYFLSDYDGLLMVEGGDVGPENYGENYPKEQLDEYDAIKDTIEIACLKHAVENNKAILGFCRGLHLINTYFGGSLHLDVHAVNKNSVLHINYDNYDAHRHKITIFENTPLFTWYNTYEIMVNTYHHQGIKELAKPLLVMAQADDGLIEGVYNPEYKFIVGLQFHPERMYNEHDGNALVFKSFIESL